ncbi:MAG: F0F1 ATP synthase subunit delta [Paramuribaculum sp.]|nr:F0F1 ATP synthase subunit delta [Paramuribaculum sp.]
MNQGLIPRRYAKALYQFALQKNDTDRIYQLMKNLSEAFDNEPKLQSTLANPFVDAEDKIQLILTASGAAETDNCMDDFLKLLRKNKRLDMTRAISRAYLDIYRQENNISVVTVTSAAQLSQEGEKRLRKIIEAHLNGGSMEYTSKVNPDLIGGFTVSIGNERLDASISNELKQLRLNLLSK